MSPTLGRSTEWSASPCYLGCDFSCNMEHQIQTESRRDLPHGRLAVAMYSLDGKTAIVTGGGRRVGLAIARELFRAGARLVVHARGEVSRETRAELGEPVVVQADLRDPGAARAIV